MKTLKENINRIKRLMNLKKDFETEEFEIDDVDLEGEMTEEGEEGSAPSSGGGSTYPTVTKWETGLTRGPANPIGNAKRQDKVVRGKANTLL